MQFHSQVRTLLFTDMVESTRLTEVLGHVKSAEIFSRDDEITCRLTERFLGNTIDKSDGLLILFEQPWNAILFALEYHRSLAVLDSGMREELEPSGLELGSRIGIHHGDIILRQSPYKPQEVEGRAKPIAARVMSLARSRQILLTRAVSENARSAAQGQPEAKGLEWLPHGFYDLSGVGEPMEIFEVGIPGFSRLESPPRSDKAWPVLRGTLEDGVPSFPDQFRSRSRLHGVLLGSLWQKENPHHLLNRNLFELFKKNTPASVWPLSEPAFVVAAKSLLRDLDDVVSEKGCTARLISTTSLVDSFGIATWFEAGSLRNLVEETRKIVRRGGAGSEIWRIFLIKNPREILQGPNLPSVYAILEENRNIGLKVAIALAEVIPSRFSYEASDYYCVPGKRVLINVLPYSFLSEFSADRAFDQEIVQGYSDLSEFLVESAQKRLASAFEWQGGTLSDLFMFLQCLA